MTSSRSRAAGRAGQFRPSLRRWLLVALGAALLAWLIVAVGAANVFQARNPSLAMRFAPFDGSTMAAVADQGLVAASLDRRVAADVELLARAALARDPTLVTAWRSLGATYDIRGQRGQATRLFRFAERLSRRDIPTQLWLIEERVQANDIAGALRHYDIALRISSRTGPLLLPIMAAATSEDAIVPPLIAMLRTNPPWRNDFLYALARRAPSPDNLVRIVEGGAPRGGLPVATMSFMIDQLVARQSFDQAWRIYRRIRPMAGSERLLRNGNFEGPEYPYAFEWRFEGGPNLSAEPAALEAGRVALAIRAEGGESGAAVVRQLLRLPAGRYRLTARSGPLPDTEPARLGWRMICANNPSQTLVAVGSDDGAYNPDQALFEVPAAACPAQWLELRIRTEGEVEHAGAWIDDISLNAAVY